MHALAVQSSCPCPAPAHRREPCLGAVLGAREFSVAESVLNMQYLRDSYSQMGPDKIPKTSAAATRHHFCPVL